MDGAIKIPTVQNLYRKFFESNGLALPPGQRSIFSHTWGTI
jgi:hypothetical protein